MNIKEILKPKSREEIETIMSKLNDNELKKVFLSVIDSGNEYFFGILTNYCRKNRPLFHKLENELSLIFESFNTI